LYNLAHVNLNELTVDMKRDQQGYWWMALKARGVCSCQRKTFWTFALLNMSTWMNLSTKDKQFSLHLNNVSTLPCKTRHCYLWDMKALFLQFWRR